MPRISVLRWGHRKDRDKRVTTHVFLAARALGASGGILCGDEDDGILSTVRKVSEKWGGKFPVKYSKDWKGDVRKHKKAGFSIVHLTMYGERLQDKVRELRKKRKMLVLVGAQKVPAEMYSLADFNIAVTNQPHSEVAALAVFLHELFVGKELFAGFRGAKIAVKPCGKGKTVVTRPAKIHLYK